MSDCQLTVLFILGLCGLPIAVIIRDLRHKLADREESITRLVAECARLRQELGLRP